MIAKEDPQHALDDSVKTFYNSLMDGKMSTLAGIAGIPPLATFTCPGVAGIPPLTTFPCSFYVSHTRTCVPEEADTGRCGPFRMRLRKSHAMSRRHMCPRHTHTYVSEYSCICVLILVDMCVCVLTLICDMSPHTDM